jgi:hypothetical protein
VPPVVRGNAQILVAPRLQRADEQQRSLKIEDGVAERHLGRQHAARERGVQP